MELQVVVNSDIGVLGFIGDVQEAFVEEVHRLMGARALVPQRLEVALSEAVSNAVLHGNRNRPQATIKVGFQYDADELVVRVHDSGPGFDPDTLPTPSSTLREGGRGIFLIKHIMDSVRSTQDADGHVLIMRKALP